jgi:hypothetical protein
MNDPMVFLFYQINLRNNYKKPIGVKLITWDAFLKTYNRFASQQGISASKI